MAWNPSGHCCLGMWAVDYDMHLETGLAFALMFLGARFVESNGTRHPFNVFGTCLAQLYLSPFLSYSFDQFSSLSLSLSLSLPFPPSLADRQRVG